MAVTADLAKVLDKAYEEKTLTELVDAPVAAPAVSDGDAQLLKEAFIIGRSAISVGTSTSARPPRSSIWPTAQSDRLSFRIVIGKAHPTSGHA